MYHIQMFDIRAYDQVFSLWEQTEGIGLSGADSKENIQAYLDRNPGTSFVAAAGKEIVGTVLGGHDGRRGYIYHLCVHPAHRRAGIGQTLVSRCIEVIKGCGIQKCHISVINENRDGLAFWERIGWHVRSDIGMVSINL